MSGLLCRWSGPVVFWVSLLSGVVLCSTGLILGEFVFGWLYTHTTGVIFSMGIMVAGTVVSRLGSKSRFKSSSSPAMKKSSGTANSAAGSREVTSDKSSSHSLEPVDGPAFRLVSVFVGFGFINVVLDGLLV